MIILARILQTIGWIAAAALALALFVLLGIAAAVLDVIFGLGSGPAWPFPSRPSRLKPTRRTP